jgi:hypothetical protein
MHTLGKRCDKRLRKNHSISPKTCSGVSSPGAICSINSDTRVIALQASGVLAGSTRRGLFDHLVGAPDQRVGNVDAERLAGLQVDDQFDLGCLLDRQVGGFVAFENPTGIDAGNVV